MTPSREQAPAVLTAALLTLCAACVGAGHPADPADLSSPGAGPVAVTVGLSLNDVYVDLMIYSDQRRRVTDEAVVTGWLTLQWTDASLVGHDGSPVRLGEDTWTPDIRHLNSIGASGDNLFPGYGEAVVDESGTVRVQSFVQLRARFIPSLMEDDFVIRLGSRLRTTAEQDLLPAGDSLDMGEYTGWYVHETGLKRNETSRAGFATPFAVIEARITPSVL